MMKMRKKMKKASMKRMMRIWKIMRKSEAMLRLGLLTITGKQGFVLKYLKSGKKKKSLTTALFRSTKIRQRHYLL